MAIEILNIMSFLFPENISVDTFTILYDREVLNAALGLLRFYSMTNAGSISSEYVIHRLVQKVINLYLENNPYQFRKIALKTEALVMYYSKNMETRFHYIHFLFNIIDHPELEKDLQFKASFKRISSILMVDDVKMWNYFLDIAYNKFPKEKYIEYLTICFLNYRKIASPFYVLNTLGYIEKKLFEGKLTKGDVKSIISNQVLMSHPEYRVSYISTIPEKRAAQLYIVSRISDFRKKIFSDQLFISCSNDRKRRSIISCLQKKQALKEEQQQKFIKHLGNVRQIARFTSTSLFSKDTLAAILRGDFRGVAINFGLLLSGRLFEGLSNALLVQGERLSAEKSA